MKKIILSCAMMLFLMSFTKSSNIQDKEELSSPECFDYADNWTSWKANCAGFNSYADEFNYWELMYNDCQSNSDNDEFQFPN